MDPAVRLTLSSSSIVPQIKEALACSVIVVVISTMYARLYCFSPLPGLIISRYSIYGITILQAYIYFQNSSQDSTRLGLFVSQAASPTRGELMLVVRRSPFCCRLLPHPREFTPQN